MGGFVRPPQAGVDIIIIIIGVGRRPPTDPSCRCRRISSCLLPHRYPLGPPGDPTALARVDFRLDTGRFGRPSATESERRLSATLPASTVANPELASYGQTGRINGQTRDGYARSASGRRRRSRLQDDVLDVTRRPCLLLLLSRGTMPDRR